MVLGMLYLLVNNTTLMLVIDCTYEFTNETANPCLMYWTYAQTNDRYH